MPHTNEQLQHLARQLIGLAQVRNTLPRADQSAVLELYADATANGSVVIDNFTDKQLEQISTLAATYLCRVS